MNNILEKWTNASKSYNLNTIILNKLKAFYEELNNIKLNHLNKLDDFWCYSKENKDLYLCNLIINKKKKI